MHSANVKIILLICWGLFFHLSRRWSFTVHRGSLASAWSSRWGERRYFLSMMNCIYGVKLFHQVNGWISTSNLNFTFILINVYEAVERFFIRIIFIVLFLYIIFLFKICLFPFDLRIRMQDRLKHPLVLLSRSHIRSCHILTPTQTKVTDLFNLIFQL